MPTCSKLDYLIGILFMEANVIDWQDIEALASMQGLPFVTRNR